MSKLLEIMSRLGAGAGQAAGVALNWDEIERQRKVMEEEQAFERQQRENTLKAQTRQIASQDFDIIQKRAAATKDPAQLAALANQGTEVLRKGGFNVPNQKIVGGMALLPQPRPTPEMQGPMPLTKQHTYDTPGTKAAARGMLLLPAQNPEFKPVEYGRGGLGLWTVPTDGSAPTFKEMRAPDETTGSILSYNGDGTATVVPKTLGTTVHTKPTKGRAPAKASKGPRRTKVEIKGDRKITTDLDTGAVLKDEPAKAAPAPKAPKPFDEAKAVRDSKTIYEDPTGREKLPGGKAPPEVQQKRDEYVRKKKAEHARGSGQKPLEQRLKDMGLL